MKHYEYIYIESSACIVWDDILLDQNNMWDKKKSGNPKRKKPNMMIIVSIPVKKKQVVGADTFEKPKKMVFGK